MPLHCTMVNAGSQIGGYPIRQYSPAIRSCDQGSVALSKGAFGSGGSFLGTAASTAAGVIGVHEKVLARTPAQRWGTPDDFTGIAIFLGSPASNFITGVAIPVDGGYSIQG
jgi:NAD(P)-dependent dehydrogenase (short-subunit alcohol dehydrogenase family)